MCRHAGFTITEARAVNAHMSRRDERLWHATCAPLLLTLCRTWAQMVSRFEALLQCYQEHCVSRTAMLLHLHSTDPLSVQEVGVGRLRCKCSLPCRDVRRCERSKCVDIQGKGKGSS